MAPRYVSGEVRVRGAETVIVPVALVVETGDGARRMVQPAVDRGDPAAASAFEQQAASETPPGPPAVAEHVHDLQSALGELLVTGAARADRGLRDAWAALAERGEALGSVLLTATTRGSPRPSPPARTTRRGPRTTRSPPPSPSPQRSSSPAPRTRGQTP